MITTATAVLAAAGTALPVAIAAYLVGAHDPIYRRAVYRTERARADKDVRAEYEVQLAFTREARDLESTGRREAARAAKTRGEQYTEIAGQLADADAALGRLDALADALITEGRPATARRITAAIRGEQIPVIA